MSETNIKIQNCQLKNPTMFKEALESKQARDQNKRMVREIKQLVF